VIATNEAADVLRHGWQDAASTLAADIPEVAELLQARLEMAIASQRLDERHLLDTIEEVESVSSRAGSPASQALARRLRRTVYEYLLALDAARPLENARVEVEHRSTSPESRMVGAEEVAALGHMTLSGARAREHSDTQPTEAAAPDIEVAGADAVDADVLSDDLADLDGGAAGEDTVILAIPTSRRRFALRRRQRHGPGDTTDAIGDDALEADDAFLGDGPPTALGGEVISPTDGDALGAGPDAEAGERAEAPAGDVEPAPGDSAESADPAQGATDANPLEASFDLGAPTEAEAPVEGFGPVVEADAAEEVTELPAETGLIVDDAETALASAALGDGRGDAEAPAFVAPRAGFHIVDERTEVPDSGGDETPLTMPVFAADELAATEAAAQLPDAPPQPPAGGAPGAGHASASATSDESDAEPEFLAWRPTTNERPSQPPVGASEEPEVRTSSAPELAPVPPPIPVPAAEESGLDAAAIDLETEESEAQRGWRVRPQGEERHGREGSHSVPVPEIEDDPFENNIKLADTRRRIEDRLRRKHCDEAAALLQGLALETGGRAVAELAMNSGDRCRALGKSNAALNCYLAASRSDPVYELPLSRLADICIDDKETDLAVSYLERIARIFRFRGDEKSALRVYRRIATIAPYREDVLTLLMAAQRTGRLE
jgi:hypothetical protein